MCRNLQREVGMPMLEDPMRPTTDDGDGQERTQAGPLRRSQYVEDNFFVQR